MGAITLPSGRSVVVDVTLMTVREWRDFVSNKGAPERDDAIVSKCSGIPADELPDLLRNDYRAIVLEIVKEAQAPLSDPNSVSAST